MDLISLSRCNLSLVWISGMIRRRWSKLQIICALIMLINVILYSVQSSVYVLALCLPTMLTSVLPPSAMVSRLHHAPSVSHVAAEVDSTPLHPCHRCLRRACSGEARPSPQWSKRSCSQGWWRLPVWPRGLPGQGGVQDLWPVDPRGEQSQISVGIIGLQRAPSTLFRNVIVIKG